MRVSAIPHVASDGQPAWTRYHGELGNRVTAEGDLIVDLKDLGGDEFVNDGVLDRWALANDFSVDGFHRSSAFMVLYMKTVHRFLGEVGADDPRIESVRAILAGEPGDAEHFRVQVDKTFAMSVLTEAFDGPFEHQREFLAVIEHRVGSGAAWRAPGD